MATQTQRLGKDQQGQAIQALTIPPTGATTSLNTSVVSAATSALTGGVYRLVAQTEGCFIVLGATATTGDLPMRANVEEYFMVPDGSTVAAITGSGTGVLKLTLMR